MVYTVQSNINIRAESEEAESRMASDCPRGFSGLREEGCLPSHRLELQTDGQVAWPLGQLNEEVRNCLTSRLYLLLTVHHRVTQMSEQVTDPSSSQWLSILSPQHGLLKHRFLGLTLRDSESVGLGVEPENLHF